VHRRYVLVTAAELDRAEHFFARYRAITVFVGRLLPVVRCGVVVSAFTMDPTEDVGLTVQS
jgi:membrane protein DedA with SNARE-associated domain